MICRGSTHAPRCPASGRAKALCPAAGAARLSLQPLCPVHTSLHWKEGRPPTSRSRASSAAESTVYGVSPEDRRQSGEDGQVAFLISLALGLPHMASPTRCPLPSGRCAHCCPPQPGAPAPDRSPGSMLAAQLHADGQVPWCCGLWRACSGGLWLSQAQRIGKRADMPRGAGRWPGKPSPSLGRCPARPHPGTGPCRTSVQMRGHLIVPRRGSPALQLDHVRGVRAGGLQVWGAQGQCRRAEVG